MPEDISDKPTEAQLDPATWLQYDTSASKTDQWHDLYHVLDHTKIVTLCTYRNNVGPVGRSMGVAARQGPDLLFISNKHSRKFKDLEANKQVQVVLNDTKTMDWVSITGVATTTSSDDPRIKDLYSPLYKPWFGDMKDGVHDGTWKDPRMALIEVKSIYITYYKKEVGTFGFLKEVGHAALTGQVAHTGVLRELSEEEIESERRFNADAQAQGERRDSEKKHRKSTISTS